MFILSFLFPDMDLLFTILLTSLSHTMVTASCDKIRGCVCPSNGDTVLCSGSGPITVDQLVNGLAPSSVELLDVRGRLFGSEFVLDVSKSFTNLKVLDARDCSCDNILPYLMYNFKFYIMEDCMLESSSSVPTTTPLYAAVSDITEPLKLSPSTDTTTVTMTTTTTMSRRTTTTTIPRRTTPYISVTRKFPRFAQTVRSTGQTTSVTDTAIDAATTTTTGLFKGLDKNIVIIISLLSAVCTLFLVCILCICYCYELTCNVMDYCLCIPCKKRSHTQTFENTAYVVPAMFNDVDNLGPEEHAPDTNSQHSPTPSQVTLFDMSTRKRTKKDD